MSSQTLRPTERVGRALARVRISAIEAVKQAFLTTFGEENWEVCFTEVSERSVSHLDKANTGAVLNIMLQSSVWSVISECYSGVLSENIVSEVREIRKMWSEERFEGDDPLVHEYAKHALYVIFLLLEKLGSTLNCQELLQENEHFLFGEKFEGLSLNELRSIEQQIDVEMEQQEEISVIKKEQPLRVQDTSMTTVDESDESLFTTRDDSCIEDTPEPIQMGTPIAALEASVEKMSLEEFLRLSGTPQPHEYEEDCSTQSGSCSDDDDDSLDLDFKRRVNDLHNFVESQSFSQIPFMESFCFEKCQKIYEDGVDEDDELFDICKRVDIYEGDLSDLHPELIFCFRANNNSDPESLSHCSDDHYSQNSFSSDSVVVIESDEPFIRVLEDQSHIEIWSSTSLLDPAQIKKCCQRALEHLDESDKSTAIFIPCDEDEIMSTEIAMKATRAYLDDEDKRDKVKMIYFRAPEGEAESYKEILNKHFPKYLERSLIKQTNELISKVSTPRLLEVYHQTNHPLANETPELDETGDNNSPTTDSLGEGQNSPDLEEETVTLPATTVGSINTDNVTQEETPTEETPQPPLRKVSGTTMFMTQLKKAIAGLSETLNANIIAPIASGHILPVDEISIEVDDIVSNSSHSADGEEQEQEQHEAFLDVHEAQMGMDLFNEVSLLEKRLSKMKIQEKLRASFCPPAVNDFYGSSSPMEGSSSFSQTVLKEFEAIRLFTERESKNGKRRQYLDVCMELQDEFNIPSKTLKTAAERRLNDCFLLFSDIARRLGGESVKNIFTQHSTEFVVEMVEQTFRYYDLMKDRADELYALGMEKDDVEARVEEIKEGLLEGRVQLAGGLERLMEASLSESAKIQEYREEGYQIVN